jgi:hypothetical protein
LQYDQESLELMRVLNRLPLLTAFVLSVGSSALAQSTERDEQKRLVLVELYTSQGCDMCPEAERSLGMLAQRNPRIVPIAFHVDYFNDPWKDIFSDPLYSQRQMAYNALYTKPKNSEYGLYYTPMLMIDGEQSINGRDLPGAQAAIRQAITKKPDVALTVNLVLAKDHRSGEVKIKVASSSSRVERRELLVCAVIRDDHVVTHVGSGENANKSLTNRFPARLTKFDFITLDGKTGSSLNFPLALDNSWNAEHLEVIVFVQDKKTGQIHQTAQMPWNETKPAAKKLQSASLVR